MTSASDLSVVIPTHDRVRILERTLAALRRQTVQGFEVIVVVDGTGAPEVPPPGVTLLHQDPAGPAAARNRGAATTSRPLLLFLGDDVVPTPDLVARHLEAHGRHPDRRHAVLGLTRWHPELGHDPIRSWLDWSTTQFDYLQLVDNAGDDVGFARFYSSNVSLKRSLFDEVRGFDPDFLFAYEDLDMGYRLGQAGMVLIYAPDACGLHLHEYDLARLERRFETIAIGERLMAAKHGWFDPYFESMIRQAAQRRPARSYWCRLVDHLPRGTRLRRHAEREAHTWYLQRLADPFLRAWDRALHVVELRRFLGDRFDASCLARAAELVDEEAAAIGDELTFYRTSEAYLYDLTVFAMSGAKDPYRRELTRHVPPGGRVLDLGCGIGADGLALLEEGYDVTFADLDNPSTRYLRWRLEQRGVPATVLDIERDGLGGPYDAVFAFDVLEHVIDPFDLLARMEEVAAVVVVNVLEGDPDDPHHDRLHHELPVEALVAHARARGLRSYQLHHGRSHLLVYAGRRGA